VSQNVATNRLSWEQFRKLFKKWQNGLQKSLMVSRMWGGRDAGNCYTCLGGKRREVRVILWEGQGLS
jgi:hypothetical protein